MLFVSPIRIRTFGHDRTSVSVSINRILEQLTESAPQTRKQLAEKITPAGAEPAEAERVKMQIVSDLRWLISEGYVIEFNDGTLDLPRAKAPQPVAAKPATAQSQPAAAAAAPEAPAAAGIEAPAAEPPEAPAAADAQAADDMVDSLSAPSDEAGGMQVEQSIEPVAAVPDQVTENAQAESSDAALEQPASEQQQDAEPETEAETPDETIPSPS
jgi:hypothetical protein